MQHLPTTWSWRGYRFMRCELFHQSTTKLLRFSLREGLRRSNETRSFWGSVIKLASRKPRLHNNYSPELMLRTKLEEVQIDPANPDRKIQIGSAWNPKLQGKILILITVNLDCFTWSHTNMKGTDIGIIATKSGSILRLNPSSKSEENL